jgi:hypothetical protein
MNATAAARSRVIAAKSDLLKSKSKATPAKA